MATATMTKSAPQSAQAAFATIDLSGYDAEQSRLMDERCIVVDEQDRPIGALDKKTCMRKRTLS
jgi:isopentenyl-diphosphate Delta-isomerase